MKIPRDIRSEKEIAMLGGIHVVSIGHSPAIRFCGWTFANNGAQVTVVRSGDPTDRWSDGFLNQGSTVVDDADTGQLGSLIKNVDILIADPDFDWKSLDTVQRPITGTVHPFGPDGPYADWHGNELIYASLGGASLYTLNRDGTPVYGFGDRYQYLAGVYLYTALTSCLLKENPSSSALPQVQVSAYESVVSLLPYLTTQYEYNGSGSTQEQSGPRYVCKCRDGWVAIYAGRDWSDIAAVLSDPALEDDERFIGEGNRFANSEALNVLFDSWCADKALEEACALGEKQNVAISAVRSPAFMLDDPALAARDGWRDTVVGDRPGRVPVLPYTVNGRRPHHTPEYS